MKSPRGRRKGWLGIWSLSAVLGAVSCAAPTSVRDTALPPEYEQLIRSEWAICQNILLCLGYDVERIRPEAFRWIAHSQPVNCGGIESYGCFGPKVRTIEWWTTYPWTIRHECGHALMWELGHKPGYRCFGHGDQAFDQEFCTTFYPKETFWERHCSIQ